MALLTHIQKRYSAVLGIPSEVRVVQLLTLGYPKDYPKPKSRLPLDKIACHETWRFF
jgi:nitroreductase